jgi:hypothetical protein
VSCTAVHSAMLGQCTQCTVPEGALSSMCTECTVLSDLCAFLSLRQCIVHCVWCGATPPPAQAGATTAGSQRPPGSPPARSPTDAEMQAYRLRRQGQLDLQRKAEVAEMNASFRHFRFHQREFEAYLASLPFPPAAVHPRDDGDNDMRDVAEAPLTATGSSPTNPMLPPAAAYADGTAAWNVQAFVESAAHEAACGSHQSSNTSGASSSADVTGRARDYVGAGIGTVKASPCSLVFVFVRCVDEFRITRIASTYNNAPLNV